MVILCSSFRVPRGLAIFLVIMVMSFYGTSCVSKSPSYAFPESVFRREVGLSSINKTVDYPLLDFDCSCKLSELAAYISSKYKVLVTVSSSISDRDCNMSFSGVPLDSALYSLARQYGVDVLPLPSGGFALANASDDDRIIVSAFCSSYTPSEIQSALDRLVPSSIVSSFNDGLVMVSCRPSFASRVRDIISGFNASRQTYLLRVVEVSDWFDYDVLDGSASIVGETNQLLRDWFWGSVFSGSFSLKVGGSCVNGSAYSCRQYSVVDGEKLTFFDGESVPVARHLISDSGVNSVSGYDKINAGDKLEIVVRRFDDNSVRLDYSVSQSRISGYVDGYPRTESIDIENHSILKAGDVYCIHSSDVSNSQHGFWKFSGRRKGRYLLVSVLVNVATD